MDETLTASTSYDPFSGLIGHGAVVELLARDVASPAHAYLFTGPAGVGKATVARGFATILLCPEGGEHPEPCRSCRRVATGNHPDLVVIQPEGRTSLGVEQARSVVTQASLVPVESERRVFLVEEASLMTEQAANALLKTLEEPGSSLVFILVAESEDDFPLTVASRCRQVHMGRVPEEVLVAALEARGHRGDEARVVALVAGGRPGLALTLATRPEVAGLRRAWLSIPERISGRPGDSFQLADEIMGLLDPVAMELAGDQPNADSRDRAKRRALHSLLASGLEILASWYADAASLQLGGPIRNRDVPLPTLAQIDPRQAVENCGKVLDAVVDLAGNLRSLPVLASLFTNLAEEN
ncbi:MAG TPA: DNA polymerase III subunit [Acidimicrobiia bacterium]|nr:DNA polymerase III subunit [Acidimicrobiia bacterium]